MSRWCSCLITSQDKFNLKMYTMFRYEKLIVCVTTNNLKQLCRVWPNDVKVYWNLKVTSSLIMEGKRLELIYVMLVETTCLEKIRSNGTTDVCHACLGYLSYNKLKIMMQLLKLKGLPYLEIRGDTMWWMQIWESISTTLRRIKVSSQEATRAGPLSCFD